MKGKTKHILGVVLTLMLMVTMLCWSAPVSAGNTLQWDDEDGPEEFVAVDITDIAVGGDGAVIYAVTGPGVEFVTAGTGTAEWSTMDMDDQDDSGDEPLSGSYSVKLTCPGGTGFDHWSAARVPYGETLATLDGLGYESFEGFTVLKVSWSIWYDFESGTRPYSMLWIDENADGIVDTRLTGGFGVALPALGTDEKWSDARMRSDAAWQLRKYTAGVIDTYDGGYTGDDIVRVDQYLADPECADAIVSYIGYGYTNSETAAYVDDITIDGNTYDLEFGSSTMYVSDDTGVSWEEATVVDGTDFLSAAFVAVAPDDPLFVAAADIAGTVYISEDAGATWDTLGEVEDTDPFNVMDIAVSLESGDNRFVAVAGVDDAARVDYYEIGALGAEWTEISDNLVDYPGWDAGDIAGAVAFSPNFNSDEMLACVTYNGTTNHLQVFSFNTEDWNDQVGGFSGYPVDLNPEDEDTVSRLVAAEIAMSPDYLGSDDDMRQLFVGIAGTTVGEADGIFFCDDDDVEALEYGELIHSIDFDGTNLVAGSHDSTTVFMSGDPLEGEDADVDSSSSSKSPGGVNQTVARFAGGDVVVAGTCGDDSAFSVSEDLGDNFNDITLIDGAIADDGLIDFAISADGSVMYLLTADDDNDMSLWSYNDDSELWERVRFVDNETNCANYILRIAPDDPDVVYLAETGSTTMYYSSDGGASKWNNRSSRYEINDMAVETTGGVLYVLTNNGYVSRSVNTGFTWGGKETSGQSGDYSITSLGEDLLLIGGDEDNPSVSYSTDGNESWTDLDALDDDGNVQVCAEGLADGDYIWAVTDQADSGIWWLEIGEDDWEDDLGVLTGDQEGTGIALADGILYVLSANSTDSLLTRFLDPWGDEADDESTAGVTAVFDATPSALRVSAGSTMLWAVSSSDAGLYMYEDTIATVAPTLKGPKDGFTVPINEISGYPADVNLAWESPSDEIEEFEFKIAFDEDFDEELPLATTNGDPNLVTDSFDEGDVASVLIDGDGLAPGTTFFWRVKVTDPVESPWSDTWSFTVAEAEAAPPVTLEIPPAPEITVEMPAPEVTVTVPPMVQVPPAPAPTAPGFIWGIIVIGALLVIALIVLIIRTRRVV